jgi:hypothetical protein
MIFGGKIKNKTRGFLVRGCVGLDYIENICFFIYII